MKESISIKNFGGLKDVTIPLNSINIFIGKQASGKSVTAKLIYFFRKIFEEIFDGLLEEKSQKEIDEIIIERFKKYFPTDSWAKGKFSISYECGDESELKEINSKRINLGNISVQRKGKDNIKLNCSRIVEIISVIQKQMSDDLQQERGKSYLQKTEFSPKELHKLLYQIMSQEFKQFGFQFFVPAGRAFFSNIQNSIFSIISKGNSIDPFIIDFGSVYERFKNYEIGDNSDKSQKYIQEKLTDVLGADFFCDKTGDYLIHKDERKINLLYCSSGQQEALPLIIILKNLVAVLNSFELITSTIYIEEPEAHLFPSAQKTVVEMIATTHNLAKGKSQLVITTHSPYILTSFNNLLEAGRLLEQGVSKRKIFKIVPEFEILKPGELNAYAFADGDVVSLIDEETGLISADLLDQVSEEIAVQFDELLEL